MRVVIAGGGTGGHLFPGIAIAQAFQKRFDDCQILFVGTKRGLESRVLQRYGYTLATIPFSRLKNAGVFEKAATILRLPLLFAKAMQILSRFAPDLVLGVGGYASGPAVMTAAAMGLPTAICEQNSKPGLTNRLLSRVAGRIFVAFEAATAHFPMSKLQIVGNPVRDALAASIDRRPGTDSQRHVLVFGGSQGARFLNQQMPGVLASIRSRLQDRGVSLRIVHQTGPAEHEQVCDRYRRLRIDAEVTPFIEAMGDAYNRADLVVCRAGALTVSELAVTGRGSILVSFPYAADDHQTSNAMVLVNAGAAIIVQQRAFVAAKLTETMTALLADGEHLAEMGRRAAGLAITDSAERIVTTCAELVNR